MMRSLMRFAAAAGFAIALASCAGAPPGGTLPNRLPTATDDKGEALQCVPFARAHSGIDIHGDAYTWWDQAAGRFARASQPQLGAVMVLYNYAGPTRAHLAVVRSIDNAREIRVDHANWFDAGDVDLDDPVLDVSAGNDWSLVRVWNLRAGAWGAHVYPVQGFIGPGPAAPDTAPNQPIAMNLPDDNNQ